MSIINTFDNSEEIVKPSKIIDIDKKLPKIIVAFFSNSIERTFLNMFETKIITVLNAGYKISIYEINYNGMKIGCYHSPLGGPASAGILEEVLGLGAEKVLFFGSCGTLDKSIGVGHFIIPTEAYRDEGVSYHYLPESDYLKIKTSKELEKAFKEAKIPYVLGKTWTTDAIYRETKNNMQKRKDEGCVSVEMECASVMAVGQYRNANVYQFLYGEDTLDGIEWDLRGMGHIGESNYQKYILTALEIAIRL